MVSKKTASLPWTPGLFSVFWSKFTTVVVWMVSARPPISNPSSLFTKPLVIVPSAPIITGITITFMFYSFLVLLQGLSICLTFRFLWFSLCGPPRRQSSLYSGFSFLLLIIIRCEILRFVFKTFIVLNFSFIIITVVAFSLKLDQHNSHEKLRFFFFFLFLYNLTFLPRIRA